MNKQTEQAIAEARVEALTEAVEAANEHAEALKFKLREARAKQLAAMQALIEEGKS